AWLTDKPLPVAEGHVSDVAFSPDGRTLAAGYGGGGVLWDVARRARPTDKPLPVAEGGVSSRSFSPDGRTPAARHGDLGRGGGGVVLWDVDLDSWRRHAGQLANRNLTRAEWLQYFPPDRPYRPTFDDLPVPP